MKPTYLSAALGTLLVMLIVSCGKQEAPAPGKTDGQQQPSAGKADSTEPPPAPKTEPAAPAPAATAAPVWVASSNDAPVPTGAVIGGHEHPPGSEDLYVCRASFNNGVHPGKYRAGFKGCNIGWGGVEHTLPNYELLTGQVTWASASDGIIPTGAISGGQEAPPGAEVLYVCRANYQNGLHLGKLRSEFKGCHVSWGGKEINVAQYEAPIAK